MTDIVALVSCVKSKQPHAARAADLYISSLFRFSRRYAEAFAGRWFILSAEHGLLSPDRRIESYERTLKSMNKSEREQWAKGVIRALETNVLPGTRLIVLAGQPYVTGWRGELEGRYVIEEPLRGLGLGQRLQWLRAKTRGADHS